MLMMCFDVLDKDNVARSYICIDKMRACSYRIVEEIEREFESFPEMSIADCIGSCKFVHRSLKFDYYITYIASKRFDAIEARSDIA